MSKSMEFFISLQNATGFSLYTYDTQVFHPPSDTKHLVYYHDPLSGCPASAINITVNRATQGVVFINMRPPGFTSSCQEADSLYTTINICEVKVMGKCHFLIYNLAIVLF